MAETKGNPAWRSNTVDVQEMVENSAGHISEKLGNEHDQRGMIRMGKKPELRRDFHFFSIWGFAVILGCSWEYVFINGVLSLPNGGTAGSVWVFLIACVGMFFVALSMAEMASIAPTAGGQYHWCSELSPPNCQKFLSYTVGYLCVLGWHASLAGTCYASGQQIQAIIVLARSDYQIQNWQTAMLAWAVVLLAVFANTVLIRKLPAIEKAFMCLHVLGFFAFIIVLWYVYGRQESSNVIILDRLTTLCQ